MDNLIKFDERGLAPAIVQDAENGEVLMLAWMNAEALRLTIETRQAHFWSRSRQELWHKGATSGNVQHVEEIRLDCDGDALLLRAHPAGPACHTGERSCFYRTLETGIAEAQRTEKPGKPPDIQQTPPFTLDTLFEVIRDRQENPMPGSYTASLFAKGEDEIMKKVGEEAIEVILAAKAQGKQRMVEESADLVYHLLVLLAEKGLTPGDVLAELERRHR